jgi:hypothetical protein
MKKASRQIEAMTDSTDNKNPKTRRAGQTDDEVKDEIRAQLLPGTDGPKRKALKKSTAKKAAKK